MNHKRNIPMWRSLLFVPVNVDRFVNKAHLRGADAIHLDLEDSIPAQEKDAARTRVLEAAEKVGRGGSDVVVRINRPWRMAVKDLEATISPGVNAVTLPKVESAQHIEIIDEIISDLEFERGMNVGHTKLIAMIETASAFFRVDEIAVASERLVGLALGSEDFALSLGMLPEPEGLFYPKMHVLIAARKAGLLPLGFIGTVANYKDLEGYRQTIRRSRRLGFEGANCVHPSQVAILNEEFTPSEESIAWARRVVEAYERATAEGRGSIDVDGAMVDVPIVQRAEALLQRYDLVQDRERQAT